MDWTLKNIVAACWASAAYSSPLFAQDLTGVFASMSSQVQLEMNTTMTIEFTTPVMMPMGTTVTATLGNFGSSVVANPTVVMISGWGTTTITGSYASSTNTLTVTTASAAVPENTSLSFSVAVSQNPPGGTTHTIRVSTSQSTTPVDASEIGFGPMPATLTDFDIQ